MAGGGLTSANNPTPSQPQIGINRLAPAYVASTAIANSQTTPQTTSQTPQPTGPTDALGGNLSFDSEITSPTEADVASTYGSLGTVSQSSGEGGGGAARAATGQVSGSAAPTGTNVVGANTLGGGYFTASNGIVYSAATGQPLYAENAGETLSTVNGVPIVTGGVGASGIQQSISPGLANYETPAQAAASYQTGQQTSTTGQNILSNATVVPTQVALGQNSPANAIYYSPGGTATYYNIPSLPSNQVTTLTEADLFTQPTTSQQIDYANFGNNASIQISGNQFSGSYVQDGQTYNFNGTLPTTVLNNNNTAYNAAVDSAFQSVYNAAQKLPLVPQGYASLPIDINADTGQISGGGLIQVPIAPINQNASFNPPAQNTNQFGRTANGFAAGTPESGAYLNFLANNQNLPSSITPGTGFAVCTRSSTVWSKCIFW